MHIGTKLILRYSKIYVEQYYELTQNCIGFNLKDFDVFMYKVLILLKTKNRLIVCLYNKLLNIYICRLYSLVSIKVMRPFCNRYKQVQYLYWAHNIYIYLLSITY